MRKIVAKTVAQTVAQTVAFIGVSLIGLAATSQAAVMTSAGEITGIGGSRAQDDTVTLTARYSGDAAQSDKQIHIVLNLGSVQEVDVITFINRVNTSTNLAIRTLAIFVADDEGAEEFDPFSLSSYTTSVYGNQGLTPSIVTGGAARSADITDAKRQYFLITFTDNFHTAGNGFSEVGNLDRVQFADIRVSVIPEPSALLLGGAIVPLLALLRFKRR